MAGKLASLPELPLFSSVPTLALPGRHDSWSWPWYALHQVSGDVAVQLLLFFVPVPSAPCRAFRGQPWRTIRRDEV